ncbi:uncharacterized protein V1516DRAFT_622175 [Lipomyces oligophaga]|uniref:uncharacterized protein n=1 Tax=Lipomyces oligophaga TaxID=45792 RepID=UPI0034CD6655
MTTLPLSGLTLIDLPRAELTLAQLEALEAQAQMPVSPKDKVIQYYLVYIYSLLRSDELAEAKFVLRRAPRNIFTHDSDELVPADPALVSATNVTTIVHALDYYDFQTFFNTANLELARLSDMDISATALKKLVQHVRDKNYNFISKAFVSTTLTDLVPFFGMDIEQIRSELLSRGWTISRQDASIILSPTKIKGIKLITNILRLTC